MCAEKENIDCETISFKCQVKFPGRASICYRSVAASVYEHGTSRMGSRKPQTYRWK